MGETSTLNNNSDRSLTANSRREPKSTNNATAVNYFAPSTVAIRAVTAAELLKKLFVP
jgi:hypothetical protein